MKSDQDYSTADSHNVINQIWSKYFPFWPIFLLLIIVSIFCAWAFTSYQIPIYESTATILIKDEKRGFEDSKMIESLNPISGKKTIENEIEIIKSRPLIKNVVTQLSLYAPIVIKNKLTDVSGYATSPIKISAQNIDSFKEVHNLKFKYDGKKGTIKVNDITYAINNWVTTPWGILKFSSVTNTSSDVFYFSLIKPQRVIENITNRLDITSGKISSVINLKIRDEVPERSADILNTLITVYEKAAITDKNILADNTLSFVVGN